MKKHHTWKSQLKDWLAKGQGRHAEYSSSVEDLVSKLNDEDTPNAPIEIACPKDDQKLKGLIFGHYEIESDGLILDLELGSIGLIHEIGNIDSASTNQPTKKQADLSKVWASQVKKALDQAGYLRHLLTQDREHQAGVWFVEVVFVITPNQSRGVGMALREMGQNEAHIQSIGINLLPLSNDNGNSTIKERSHRDSAFGRAFSWLMTSVFHWYSNQQYGSHASDGKDALSFADVLNGKGKGKLIEKLKLENFRVAGERSWEVAPKEVLHIIQGKNGSGKSSLTEAIEFSVCGSVQRLRGMNHRSALVNHQVLESHFKGEQDAISDYLAGKDLVDHTEKASSLSEKCFVEMIFSDKESHCSKIKPTGSDRHLGEQFVKEAFILDQVLADALSLGDAKDRARIFTKAFFPEDGKVIEELERASLGLKEARAQLPKWIVTHLGEQESSWPVHGWGMGKPVTAKEFFQLFDAGPVVRKLLAPYCSKAENSLHTWLLSDQYAKIKEDEVFLGLDLVFSKTAKEAHGQCLVWKQRIHLLEMLDLGFTERGQATTPLRQVAADLNAWLETTLLLDFIEKQLEISSAVSPFNPRSKGLENASVVSLLKPGKTKKNYFQELTETRSKLQKDHEALVERLDKVVGDIKASETLESNISDKIPSVRTLNASQIKELDIIADALGYRVQGNKSLGNLASFAWEHRRVRIAKLSTGHSLMAEVNLGSTGLDPGIHHDESLNLEIGHPGAFHELIPSARNILKAWESIDLYHRKMEQKDQSLRDILVKFQNFSKAYDAYDKPQEIMVQGFADKLNKELGAPLNELLALMTPARWAYEDILTQADLRDGEKSLNLNTGSQAVSIPISLKLNTAELNCMTISLFLLCAIRSDNPVNMLVMDDPLQNMDEMTVASVARAFARITRLWKVIAGNDEIQWRLLMFLHGENNLERFREECPCVAYLMPWLRPVFGDYSTGDETTENNMNNDNSKHDHQQRKLDNLDSELSLRKFEKLKTKEWLMAY